MTKQVVSYGRQGRSIWLTRYWDVNSTLAVLETLNSDDNGQTWEREIVRISLTRIVIPE